MGDVGVHLVDLVRWLAGDLKRVCSQQAIFTKERSLADGSGKREVTVRIDADQIVIRRAGESAPAGDDGDDSDD